MIESFSVGGGASEALTVQLVTALAAAFAALAAVVGPLLAYRVGIRQIAAATKTARNQIKSATKIAEGQIWAASVSQARRDWNDELRIAIAELLSNMGNFASELTAGKINREKADTYFDRILHLQYLIFLYIHPDDPLQAALEKSVQKSHPALRAVFEALKGGDEEAISLAEKSVGGTHGEIIFNARRVFDAQWEKIKDSSTLTPTTEE